MTFTLHFTLGPVQDFIADARRLRDFWAGSFLLSYLSGCAMVAVAKHGQIDFPKNDGDPLFDAINTGAGSGPHVGSLPNRFRASGISDPQKAANEATKAVGTAWAKIADTVWDKFLKGNADQKTEDIWKRQIHNFWNIAWVALETGKDDPAALDRRKNWRLPIRPDEPGDLCRLMGQFQELSGARKFGDKKHQQEFWAKLYDGCGLGLNLDSGEYLCAIALIKRLFPLVAKEAIGWEPGNGVDILNWPSTSYICAVPWLRRFGPVIKSTPYKELVKQTFPTGALGEFNTTHFKGLGKNDPSHFSKHDGHLYHKDGLQALFKEKFKGKDVPEDKKRAMQNALADLHRQAGGGKSLEPSEFYAVLQMDGDRIGNLLSRHPGTVKEALFRFTAKVSDYFHPNQNVSDGVLVYAGGDDVMAFLPLEHAISAAQEIRKLYRDAVLEAIGFTGEAADAEAFTLSAAIVFAQYKIPMRAVLREAKSQLEHVAKVQNGRDSLALAVYKPGGVTQSWVSGWCAQDSPIDSLRELIAGHCNYSTGFAYNLLERYQELLPDGVWTDESVFDETIIRALVRAEYIKNTATGKLSDADVTARLRPVENALYPLCNGAPKRDPSLSALPLARFVASQYRERE